MSKYAILHWEIPLVSFKIEDKFGEVKPILTYLYLYISIYNEFHIQDIF